jgi:hypothetical protein
VPLSLKEAEVAYFIEKTDEAYLVETEEKRLWDRLISSSKIYITDQDKVYFFSSVFAPSLLETDIVHRWQYYDEKKKRWTDRTVISFPIVGGRDGGYRGYSLSDSVFPGSWRVKVETAQGHVIGKKNFKVIEGKAQNLVKTIK